MIEQLSIGQVAELAGVQASTWRAYVARGQAPSPDGRLGAHPWWKRRTVEKWIAKHQDRSA